MVSTRGNRDQKISFYFVYCQLFFYSATLELSTVKLDIVDIVSH